MLGRAQPQDKDGPTRRDLIVVPTAPGVYPVITEFRDWITGEIQDGGRGVCETFINVTA